MTTKREQVLSALFAAVQAGLVGALPAAARKAVRNDPLPEEVPAGGLIILRDGTPGEPEATMSPLRYHYEHQAEAEVFVQAHEATRDATFDQLCTILGAAVAADRTLGGLCDWVEASAPEPADLPVTGANPIKAAVIQITLHYTTTDPLA